MPSAWFVSRRAGRAFRAWLTVGTELVLVHDPAGSHVGSIGDPDTADAKAMAFGSDKELVPEGLVDFLASVSSGTW